MMLFIDSKKRLAVFLCCIWLGATFSCEAGGGRNRFLGDIPIAPVSSPLTVDGSAEDWDTSRGKILKAGDGTFYRKYNAQLNARYDDEGIYFLVVWNDESPMHNLANPNKEERGRDGGDCLVIRIQGDRLLNFEGWYSTPLAKEAVRLAYGAKSDESVELGSKIKGIEQAFSRNPNGKGYVQEIKIAWNRITGNGKAPEVAKPLRISMDLIWDDFAPGQSFRDWADASPDAIGERGEARFGGGLVMGYADGGSGDSADSVDLVVRTRSGDPQKGAVGVFEKKGFSTATVASSLKIVEGQEVSCTKKVSIVPAPANVTLGQNLQGWDKSGGFEMSYEPSLLQGRYKAKAYMMYDSKGIYVALEWNGKSSFYNVNKPDHFDWGYDGGDALQLRLFTDTKCTIEGWYNAPTQKPVLKRAIFDVRKNGLAYQKENLIDLGAKEYFTRSEDGYTQEIFLPWNLITKDGKPRMAGDQLGWICEMYWSGIEAKGIDVVGNGVLEESSKIVTLPETAKRKEYVTIVIEDEKGHRIRNLTASAMRKPGETLAKWDCLDDNGYVVPAGKYRYRTLAHTGIGWEYRMTFESPGNPPWANEDGTGAWGGETSAPQGIATYGEQIFLSWPAVEKGHGIIGADLNGQRQWGTSISVAHLGTCALAADEKYVYMATDIVENLTKERLGEVVRSQIVCFDKKTGLRRGFSLKKTYQQIGKNPWDSKLAQHKYWWEMEKEGFTPEGWGMHRESTEDPVKGSGANVMGLAVKDGLLYVSMYLFDKIVILDSKTAEEVGEISVKRPSGLCFDEKGRLLAVSERQVLAIDVKTKKAEALVIEQLEAPVGISVDASQNLYVSDWGKGMCVKVFNPLGKQIRTIGKVGGRATVGKYDPDGMLLPHQIAIDKKGQLWVTEDDGLPRRVSLWDASNGKLIKEFIGGARSGENHCNVIISPFDKSVAISFLNEYKLDWEKKTSKPTFTLWRRNAWTAMYSCIPRMVGGQTRLIRLNGRTFLVGGCDGNDAVIGEYKDGRYTPLASVGSIPKYPLITEEKGRFYPFENWAKGYYSEAFKAVNRKGMNYSWVDQNANGWVDEGEITLSKDELKQPSFDNMWGMGIGEDLSVYFGCNPYEKGQRIYRIRVSGWTTSGAPIYDPNKAELVVAGANENTTVLVDGKGRILTAINGEWTIWIKGLNPVMTCYSPTGEKLWTYPISFGAEIGKVNGNTLIGPVKLPGEMGEMVSLSQYHGSRMPLITTDGLYVASILRDAASASSSGPDVCHGESQQTIHQTSDGKIYVVNGNGECNIMEVTGLDTIRRSEGEIYVKENDAAKASEILARKKQSMRPTVLTEIKAYPVPSGMSIDGKLEEWNPAYAIPIGAEVAPVHAKAWLAYDDKNLYAAWEVTKPNSFQNSNGEFDRLFLGGDCTDIQLGEKSDKRNSPIAGDIRILFSAVKGRPTAVLYTAVSPSGVTNKVKYSSGNGTVIFDSVQEITGAKVNIKDTPKGYVLEAMIPWATIGIKAPTGGGQYLGDMGIVIADATGRNRGNRIRVFNQANFFPDEPSEAKLEPEKWRTIIFEK